MSTSRRPLESSVLACSFAKVNLGLKIVGRRRDGYHDIQTLFQTVTLHDRLRFARLRTGKIDFTCNDPRVPRNSENLIVRAAQLFRKETGLRAGVAIHLEKRIPLGAGLGGGSSNAAVTLLALERLFGRRMGDLRRLRLARSLGADVPFFLCGGRALGFGRGDEVVSLPDGRLATLLLACPDLPISTAHAYRWASLGLTKVRRANNMARFRLRFFEKESVFTLFENDFERVLFARYPLLRRLKRRLLSAGATEAQMTGSGSAVFGVFSSVQAARSAEARLRSSPSLPALQTFVVRSLPRSHYAKRILTAFE
ncbi:MAG: 4-(cytidine 5'-diphospho)-2-C-methyl-D-erythritol kinase [Acidobacteriia bacterium]|nr:4-(cytidine 5'-diphospho)-2-C-methyl-D-erythritol kinase [Terriglobia bacterium]